MECSVTQRSLRKDIKEIIRAEPLKWNYFFENHHTHMRTVRKTLEMDYGVLRKSESTKWYQENAN